MRLQTMKMCIAVILSASTLACSIGAAAVQADFTTNSVSTSVSMESTSSVTITDSAGYEEAAYVEWSAVSGASGYNVYVDDTKIDSMLIRQYPSCFRADAVGLTAGSHTVKIVPIISNSEDTSKSAEVKITSTAHDRSGFGWVNGTSSGAYNEDGTLKSDAVVLYVTEDTKDTVSLDVVTSSKGATTTSVGIQNILDSYKKGYDDRPLCIRCIGNITDPETLESGDLLIKGSSASNPLSCGVTIEGIGADTVFNGFGLRIANASNVEVRNIGFMNCDSDEGDDVGLQQNNDHIWVHHCDFFYGDAGSDADQKKGDGALDTKTSAYITHSYNHFWDNGKCNLQGMKSESEENYITYHHNWFDHSDSRHPRIRTCTVHIYNNYYDGNAKYGVGVTMGASAFVENNYFRNCKYPMLSSMQGSDVTAGGIFSSETGGIIKSFGNYITGAKQYITYQEDSTEFDAYEASSRDETVPSSVTTKSGGTSYNNFDTDSSIMYSYTPDNAEDVPAIVTANAGRVQGGDFKWTFDNSVDDESYDVNEELKAALVAYQSTIVAIGSGFTDSTDSSAATTTAATTASTTTTTTSTTAAAEEPDESTAQSDTTTIIPSSAYVHNFTESGTDSSFYTISGNLSTSKGTAFYNGLTLTQCLKMESATSITFTAPADGTITLVFGDAASTIKVNDTKYTTENGVITVDVSAGVNEITKADSANLFYMVYDISDSDSESTTTTSTTQKNDSTETETTIDSTETTITTPMTTTADSDNTDDSSTTATTATNTNSFLKGDVDLSNAVNIMDVISINKAILGKETLTDEQLKAADINANAMPDAEDALSIMKYIVGLITEL